MIRNINKKNYKEIFNAEVLFREDCNADEFIDVIVGNRVYMPCVYVIELLYFVVFSYSLNTFESCVISIKNLSQKAYNKIDQISIEEVNRLAHLPHTVVIR